MLNIVGLGLRALSEEGKKFDVLLFVCLFVRHAFDGRVCANDFVIKEFEYGNVFDAFG